MLLECDVDTETIEINRKVLANNLTFNIYYNLIDKFFSITETIRYRNEKQYNEYENYMSFEGYQGDEYSFKIDIVREMV